MKLHDSIIGGILILAAGLIWFSSNNLPNPTMQPYGPGFFPKILAVFLFATSAILTVRGAAASRPLVTFSDWARDPRAVMRVLLVPVGVTLFVLGAEGLGFIPGAILLVFALALANETKPLTALIVAVVAVIVAHTIFYVGLHVQLPWGVLQPVRW